MRPLISALQQLMYVDQLIFEGHVHASAHICAASIMYVYVDQLIFEGQVHASAHICVHLQPCRHMISNKKGISAINVCGPINL